jgi:hypothetical protein
MGDLCKLIWCAFCWAAPVAGIRDLDVELFLGPPVVDGSGSFVSSYGVIVSHSGANDHNKILV